jgi:chromosome segregation ATPase
MEEGKAESKGARAAAAAVGAAAAWGGERDLLAALHDAEDAVLPSSGSERPRDTRRASQEAHGALVTAPPGTAWAREAEQALDKANERSARVVRRVSSAGHGRLLLQLREEVERLRSSVHSLHQARTRQESPSLSQVEHGLRNLLGDASARSPVAHAEPQLPDLNDKELRRRLLVLVKGTHEHVASVAVETRAQIERAEARIAELENSRKQLVKRGDVEDRLRVFAAQQRAAETTVAEHASALQTLQETIVSIEAKASAAQQHGLEIQQRLKALRAADKASEERLSKVLSQALHAENAVAGSKRALAELEQRLVAVENSSPMLLRSELESVSARVQALEDSSKRKDQDSTVSMATAAEGAAARALAASLASSGLLARIEALEASVQSRQTGRSKADAELAARIERLEAVAAHLEAEVGRSREASSAQMPTNSERPASEARLQERVAHFESQLGSVIDMLSGESERPDQAMPRSSDMEERLRACETQAGRLADAYSKATVDMAEELRLVSLRVQHQTMTTNLLENKVSETMAALQSLQSIAATQMPPSDASGASDSGSGGSASAASQRSESGCAGGAGTAAPLVPRPPQQPPARPPATIVPHSAASAERSGERSASLSLTELRALVYGTKERKRAHRG